MTSGTLHSPIIARFRLSIQSTFEDVSSNCIQSLLCFLRASAADLAMWRTENRQSISMRRSLRWSAPNESGEEGAGQMGRISPAALEKRE